MDNETAIQIAKSKKSTPEQLNSVLGFSDEVALLLAKNPNTTAEMLDELGASLDDKIAAAATAHPNIAIELLDNLGGFYPLAMFRNPALPKIMETRKNYLGEFYGDEFDDALKSKNLPEFVVDWLASNAKIEYQAIFLFGAERTPETIAKFRNSKYPKIVAQLLGLDEATYLAWATDIGFTRPPPDDEESASLKSEIDDWVEQLWSHNQVLWKELVPENGSAPTLQGELVRALGRIETEHFKNGMMNWGDGSGYYENLTKLIYDTLKAEKTFSKLNKKILDADIGEIKHSGLVGKDIASEKKPRKTAFEGNFFFKSDVEKSHQRLGALITLWCQRHPEPVPYQCK